MGASPTSNGSSSHPQQQQQQQQQQPSTPPPEKKEPAVGGEEEARGEPKDEARVEEEAAGRRGGAGNGGGGGEDDEDDENVVTIEEYVDRLEEQELEVDMILGGDDGKECTYPKGYLPRQAVFSCITCCPAGNAGVCVACSMTCHDGHEVVEIWTRRHFRCDCGNSKFGVGICKLFSSKDTENSENVYNQNFTGVYCTCKRPYPDPDCTEDVGEMLQCCVCEDWFHEVHLGLTSAAEVPRDDEGGPLFEELICQSCSSSLDFLSNYNEVLVPLAGTNKSYKDDISIESNSTEITDFTHSIASTDNCLASTAGSSKESSGLASNLNSSSTERNGFHESATGSGQNLYHCKLKSREESCPTKRNGSARSLFLMRNWRLELCQCSSCCAMYSQKGVSFLIDQDDTLIKYEETAKLKRKEKMEATNGQDLSFLNSLGHTGQIEFLHGLNDMTTELSAFFASHESGKPITSADIYGFFDNLKRKRARLSKH